ncbi:MAG: response regulator [Acidimicrobiia bacterium]|nr:response regulator [Acidimicrobiia bacterium]
MSNVLLATDADWIYDDVAAALARPDTTVSRVHAGRDVAAAVAELEPELVILDLQIGNMGGAACCRDLRLESGAGRVPETAILMLLDRDADRWLAEHAGADGWLIKPFDSLRLRRATTALLAGEPYTDGITESA